jgi:benzodiazapine receptor
MEFLYPTLYLPATGLVRVPGATIATVEDFDIWLGLVALIVLCLSAGFIGAIATRHSVRTWYPTLRKPKGTPPSWVFAPVWTTLYIVMAIAAWLVWREVGWEIGKHALIMFLGQLALNVAWSGIFFGGRQPGLAMGEIIILWLAILCTGLMFHYLLPLAGMLMLPYLMWVTYATYLNFGIWRLNPATASPLHRADASRGNAAS